MTHTARDRAIVAQPEDPSPVVLTDADLYHRGVQTLLGAWSHYARASSAASVERLVGVAAAVFPSEPERYVYNNAVLERDLKRAQRAEAIGAMEAAYRDAGITRFAAWAHESDDAMRRDLEARGYALDEVTRAMAMPLDHITVPRPDLEFRPATWPEHLQIAGVRTDLLSDLDTAAFHIVAAPACGESVTTAIAFDVGRDCGIYNVGTIVSARRRGLASALTASQLHDARERGCQTASLQSTEMAERLYAAVGFRDLGRILEYIPAQA